MRNHTKERGGRSRPFLALAPMAALAVTTIVGVVATSLSAQSAVTQAPSVKRLYSST